MSTLNVIVLAAGQGKRMNSRLPKVLHPLAGRPLLSHVIDTAAQLGAAATHVVYGHAGEQVRTQLSQAGVSWVEQAQQLGTGHAVDQAMPGINDDATVLVLYGDVPLIRAATLHQLVDLCNADRLALLTVDLDNPQGYGRIVRNDHHEVVRIVEQKDASAQEQTIREVNTGILACSARRLRGWLQNLDNRNVQQEYYLTDVVAMAVADGVRVASCQPDSADEVLGVNDKLQLAYLERSFQARQARDMLLAGVSLADPARIDLRGSLQTGQDVSIDVNVVLEGRVVLGDGVRVGPNCMVRNAEIGADVEILPNCVIEDAVIGDGCRVGPFARIRPDTRLADHCHVGNFVEIKKSTVASGSKINHLSYVGDSEVGRNVNIGAGTITCNYDGAFKHKTVIGDRVFVGSDTQLVAPVTVGAGATIGAGSTITRDVPAEELTLSRSKQMTRAGWKRPVKGP